jgi:hypothetical protein
MAELAVAPSSDVPVVKMAHTDTRHPSTERNEPMPNIGFVAPLLPGTTQTDRDTWFRDHIRSVHGISLEDGFPPPELILDYHSGELAS